jgi:invasion protein IalB
MREVRPSRQLALAAILGMWLATGLAEAREFRFPAADGLRLAPGKFSNRVVNDGTTSDLHAARNDCRRWRAAAASLGETYAGHLLRQTVVRRQCRSLDADRGEEAWEWPWTSLDEGRVLPPRLHTTYGEWEIRCGSAGGRRRCALLNSSPVSPDDALDPGDQAVVTHFVIDMIAGRETLLWRLFVPAAPVVNTAASAHAGVDAKQKSVARGKGEVRYRLEESERIELFPACAAAGCLMEASLRHAGDVATRLWEGRSIDVRISLTSGAIADLTLPAVGFRAGLKELVRLRRDESRPAGSD